MPDKHRIMILADVEGVDPLLTDPHEVAELVLYSANERMNDDYVDGKVHFVSAEWED